jgi:hypothetical protein
VWLLLPDLALVKTALSALLAFMLQVVTGHNQAPVPHAPNAKTNFKLLLVDTNPAKLKESESGSTHPSPYYVLPAVPGPLLLLAFVPTILFFCWISTRRQKRREMAVAMQKLQAQGLACVRLVNRTPGVVQVRPPTSQVLKLERPPSPTH